MAKKTADTIVENGSGTAGSDDMDMSFLNELKALGYGDAREIKDILMYSAEKTELAPIVGHWYRQEKFKVDTDQPFTGYFVHLEQPSRGINEAGDVVIAKPGDILLVPSNQELAKKLSEFFTWEGDAINLLAAKPTEKMIEFKHDGKTKKKRVWFCARLNKKPLSRQQLGLPAANAGGSGTRQLSQSAMEFFADAAAERPSNGHAASARS